MPDGIRPLHRSVNLAAAAPVMQKDLGLSNIALGIAFSAFNYSYAPFQLVGGWFADRFGARRTLTVWDWPGQSRQCNRGRAGTRIAVCRAFVARHGGGSDPAGCQSGVVKLDLTRVARKGCRHYPFRWASRRWRGRADRNPSDHLVPSWRFSFVALGILSAFWAAGWWRYFHEDPRHHPGITTAEVAALSAANPERKIAYGPVPWRRLVPRMAPMMIGYFCQGWTGWLYVTWMPSLFAKNYGLDLKKSSLFYAGTLFCAMIAELLGGMVTDYLLRRTQSLQIARSLLIAVSWVLAVASLLPAILVHDLFFGMAGFVAALFFLGFAISPIWTATMDIAPGYAGSASALMNAAGAVAGILSPVAFGWILDRTGSWTTPFTVSLGLLLFGAVVTYWFRPDRQLDTLSSASVLVAAGE